MTEVTAEVPTQPVLRNVGIFGIGDNAGRGIIPQLNLILESPPKDRPKAIILIGEVSGVTPDPLNPIIERYVQEHIPVFVIANNYGSEEGIQELKYDTHIKPADAGATHLRDVNVKHVKRIAGAIQTEINQGKTGQALNKAIVNRFGIPPRAPQHF